ncbi:hypothetical protein [Litorilituus sediminis]|uniref:Uncharacterized protein n=1 Tax=Litorilituus sediminis TaxID=718192 RepID=A0A4P6P5X9_9GAMM|nr:hypothetical protein [Litorilituus sediminis]QBG34847.1 hypothetical protein EMK97_03365 [Litorilituus sediminis]
MKFRDIKKSAIICAIFGVGLLVLFSISGKVPNRENLTKIEGNIDWVKATGKHGDTLRFKFQEDDTHLVYHSIGGKTSKTHSALAKRGAHISVLYDQTDSHSPPFDENEYHTIYELVQDGNIVRSHDVMVEKYAANSRLAGWMGLGSLIFSAGLFLAYNRKKNAN